MPAFVYFSGSCSNWQHGFLGLQSQTFRFVWWKEFKEGQQWNRHLMLKLGCWGKKTNLKDLCRNRKLHHHRKKSTQTLKLNSSSYFATCRSHRPIIQHWSCKRNLVGKCSHSIAGKQGWLIPLQEQQFNCVVPLQEATQFVFLFAHSPTQYMFVEYFLCARYNAETFRYFISFKNILFLVDGGRLVSH